MAGLVCWSCGAGLRGVPRPIRRLSQCPRCRADLHVCRMCRHWDPAVLGECRHERAERVADKASANFCTYYRPRPEAHRPPPRERAEQALAELDALFGIDAEAAADRPPLDPAERARREAEEAQRRLRELFGGGEDGRSEGEGGEGKEEP